MPQLAPTNAPTSIGLQQIASFSERYRQAAPNSTTELSAVIDTWRGMSAWFSPSRTLGWHPCLPLPVTGLGDCLLKVKVGEDGYIYRLEYSKTQQTGVKVDSTPDKPILGRSAEALAMWLEAAKIHEGTIFRRIWKEPGRPCPASRLGGRNRETPGPFGRAGGGLWGAQS